jgi:uncharacterized protein YggE
MARKEVAVTLFRIPSSAWLAAALAIVFSDASHAQTPTDPGPPVVVTSGEAVVRVAPDRAFIVVQAESRARSPRDAQKANAEAMEDVQDALRDARVPADAIKTVSYSVQPDYEFRDNRRTLRGYVAFNTIEVRVDDINRVGEIIDRAGGSGATSIGGIRFELKDRDAVERQALRQAVADARARAEAAAAGAGQAIAKILRIEEQRTSFPVPRGGMVAMRMDAAEASAQTPVVAGEIEVRSNVTLTAALR